MIWLVWLPEALFVVWCLLFTLPFAAIACLPIPVLVTATQVAAVILCVVAVGSAAVLCTLLTLGVLVECKMLKPEQYTHTE